MQRLFKLLSMAAVALVLMGMSSALRAQPTIHSATTGSNNFTANVNFTVPAGPNLTIKFRIYNPNGTLAGESGTATNEPGTYQYSVIFTGTVRPLQTMKAVTVNADGTETEHNPGVTVT
jgi:hypothetical protein